MTTILQSNIAYNMIRNRMSAQNYLRQQTGIVVTMDHKHAEGKFQTCVIDSSGVRHLYDDDAFGTLTAVAFEKVYEQAAVQTKRVRQFNRYSPNTAQVFGKAPLTHSLPFFDKTYFDKFIVPTLRKETSAYPELLEFYDDSFSASGDEYDQAESIFRIFYHLRHHMEHFDFGHQADPESAIRFEDIKDRDSVVCIALIGENDPFLPAIRVWYKEGSVVELEGNWYYSCTKVDPFKAISSKSMVNSYDDLTISLTLNKVESGASQEEDTKAPTDAGGLIGELLAKINRLKYVPLQKMTPSEKSWTEDGLTEGRIALSKNGLRGHGKIVGTGKFEDCLNVYAAHVQAQNTREASYEDCLQYAAGRLVRMSEKRLSQRADGWYIESA